MIDRTMHKFFLIPLIVFALTGHAFATDLEWVRVTEDSKGFALEKSGKPFVP
jgi:hypothetical protein